MRCNALLTALVSGEGGLLAWVPLLRGLSEFFELGCPGPIIVKCL